MREMMRPNRFRRPAARAEAPLGLYITLGIVPTLGICWAAVMYARGELPLDKLPSGTGGRLWALGGLLLAFLVAARFTLPPVHAIVSRCERGMRFSMAVLRGKVAGRRGVALVALPALGLAWVATYPVRFVLLVLILAIFVWIAILTVQLFQPDFLAGWLPAFMRPSPR